jgi:hypothetical protein
MNYFKTNNNVTILSQNERKSEQNSQLPHTLIMNDNVTQKILVQYIKLTDNQAIEDSI